MIALSTHGRMVDRIKGSEAGVDVYLAKPLNAEELERALRRLCPGVR